MTLLFTYIHSHVPHRQVRDAWSKIFFASSARELVHTVQNGGLLAAGRCALLSEIETDRNHFFQLRP